MIDLYFLIAAVNAQIFNVTAEFAISIGRATKKAKSEFGKQPLAAESKIRKRSKFKALQTFLCFILIKSFRFIFLQKIISCFIYFC